MGIYVLYAIASIRQKMCNHNFGPNSLGNALNISYIEKQNLSYFFPIYYHNASGRVQWDFTKRDFVCGYNWIERKKASMGFGVICELFFGNFPPRN